MRGGRAVRVRRDDGSPVGQVSEVRQHEQGGRSIRRHILHRSVRIVFVSAGLGIFPDCVAFEMTETLRHAMHHKMEIVSSETTKSYFYLLSFSG
jgi:hypothetical protein